MKRLSLKNSKLWTVTEWPKYVLLDAIEFYRGNPTWSRYLIDGAAELFRHMFINFVEESQNTKYHTTLESIFRRIREKWSAQIETKERQLELKVAEIDEQIRMLKQELENNLA